MSKSYKIAYLALFTSLAIVAGYIERLVPSPIPFPGVRLGIANVVVLLALYLMGGRFALGVNTARISVSGLLFGGISGMVYGFAGGLLSLLIMYLGKRSKIFGIIGVSVLGGVSHNFGQIFVASAVVWNIKLLYYLPVLIISGVLTGIAIGLTAGYSLERLQKHYFRVTSD